MPSVGETNYRSAIRADIRGLWTGVMDYFQAYEQMDLTVTGGITAAFHEGAMSLGVSPSSFSAAEKTELQRLLFVNRSYIDGLLQAVEQNSKEEGGKLGPLMSRGDVWVQRYNEAREIAKSMVEADPPMVWIMGATEKHCSDCSRAAGRVHRKSIWDKYGWVPNSRELACGGWRCDCRRVPTDQPLMPGRPPKLIGR